MPLACPRGTLIDLALPSEVVKASPAAAALAAAISQTNWHFALGGHEREVSSAAFSTDGSRIVTASEDNTVRIWDAASAKEIALLRGHEGRVSSAALSPDGSCIVTTSTDKTARIWDAASAKQIAVLRGHESYVFSAAFSPDGSRIVTALSDKTARIWDAASAKQIAVLPRVLGGFRRLQPRWLAHRHGVMGQHRPHLGRPDGQGDRDPARP
jgi:WD40 repeat protein